jgi:hypothetical protein
MRNYEYNNTYIDMNEKYKFLELSQQWNLNTKSFFHMDHKEKTDKLPLHSCYTHD